MGPGDRGGLIVNSIHAEIRVTSVILFTYRNDGMTKFVTKDEGRIRYGRRDRPT